MKTLVVGASGATGRLLVDSLVKNGQEVKVMVRPSSGIPDSWKRENKISIIHAHINELSIKEMAGYTKDCQAVACCLGHNMNLKGLFGKPKRLVADAIQLLCRAIQKDPYTRPVKLVLMNTAGNRNRDLKESVSIPDKIVIGLIRALLPPHSDNEAAADYLRVKIGQKNPLIEWVVLRPDSLIDLPAPSPYGLYPSPTRSAIFNPGKTSRINVANAMMRLITEHDSWLKWKGRMPVIYNEEA